ncbi:phage/plasmid primase, P4 family [Rhodopseudomonas palustris]|uniref:phage/plasmid primase, P4 family n=1 Tax=Rhodopseudomonas palustris TaxID=1076 RepID=UPI000CEBC465|nr:phage/plasmid primase, P4 family [Rhodopseudomonas palustris]PPQ42149.1 hypothetical protein CKO39_18335 [Rhodopseudomonas palustris]
MTGPSDILDLIDSAEPFEPQAAAIDADAMRKVGFGELGGILAGLRAAAGEARAPALELAAEQAGRLIGAGALHRGLAIAELAEAAREIGLGAVTAPISAAVRRGEAEPFDLVTLRRAAAPSEQRRARTRAPDRILSSPDSSSSAPPSPRGGTGEPSQPAPEAGGEGDVNFCDQIGGDDFEGEADRAHQNGDTEDRFGDSSSPSRSALSPDPSSSGEEAGETLANGDGTDDAEDEDLGEDDGGDEPPEHTIPADTFRACAKLDQSDVDNGKRLLAYFGEDLLVRQEDDVPAGQKLAWTGTHWDLSGGEALANLIGQKVGDLIKVEASYIDYTRSEAEAVDLKKKAEKELMALPPEGERDEKEKAIADVLLEVIKRGGKAQVARAKRRQARKKWGVSTKNASRINAMLACAAPHLRRHPDAFNADPLRFATLTHTLRFVPMTDDENPDPNTSRPLLDPDTGRVRWRLEATKGHNRDDMITAVVPFAFDPKATCPDFDKFLDLFQPEPKKRRTVQQFTGMSLTAQPVQRIMYHTGTGGNGKSVFLEVISRVLGDGLAVGLPAESVSGEAHNNPSAPTPDIARCYAKRFIRVSELPKDQPVKAEMVKRLTGGEKWPVRTMYKGYFEFKPTGKPHMSGNGEPKLDGTDGGLRRRFVIVPWSVTLPPEKHRDFEDVVSEIVAGGSGILNWLIAGALDFLNNGLEISDEIAAATEAHFAEMDPVQRYVDAHVRPDPGGPGVQARAMWEGWQAFAHANGMNARNETWFGRILKAKLEQNDPKARVRFYINVKLVDLPETRHPNEPPDYAPGGEEF